MNSPFGATASRQPLTRARLWAIGSFALLGLALTLAAVSRWSPEASIRMPDRAEVSRQAVADAKALGYRVDGPRKPLLSAGPRAYLTSTDVAVLREEVDDPAKRRGLLAAAPPVRMGVRFWGAVGPDGAPGALLLEYDAEVRLVGASFGWDGIVQSGLQPYAGPEFADRIASRLLGSPASEPETVKMGGGLEYVYRTGPGQAGAYVYLGGSARWIAHRQAAPYALLTRQFTFVQRSLFFQVLLYAMVAMSLLVIGVLLWRLARRRAGFEHVPLLGALLAIGLLPMLRYLAGGLAVVNLALSYLLTQASILLLWAVAEAELRDVRPASVEHWDRLVRRRPMAGSGRALVVGVIFGLGMSGIVAASGKLAELLGGGYNGLLVILPEYWLLPTPLNCGLTLAAATAFSISFGYRVAKRPGALAGTLLGGLCWSFVVPAAPLVWSVTCGILLALAAGWLMSRFGLLAMAVGSVTALSAPTAVILAPHLALRIGPFLEACLPLAILAFGAVLWRRAPEHGGADSVAPRYISELEREAMLAGEVELLREFQLSLLPARTAGSEFPQADVAWKMIPADTVGGDFLDLVEDESGRLWIAVADAAGHGIACSVLTAFTKAAVTEHVGADVGPREALLGIRRLFGRLRTTRTMVTLVLGVWDPASRRLTVANAGHPPLLVHDGRTVREIGRAASPLGTTLGSIDDPEESVELGPGAVVVGYSDGVPEAASPAGETFGYEAWPALLAEIAGRRATAAETLQLLLSGVAAHRGGRPAEDDVTALVLALR